MKVKGTDFNENNQTEIYFKLTQPCNFNAADLRFNRHITVIRSRVVLTCHND